MTARLGSARPTFARLIATNEPRCRCPRNTPSGSARTIAIAIAAPESWRCSQVFSRIRLALVDDELERVDEDAEVVEEAEDHAVLRTRAHGVSRRWAMTSSPSATSASSTASPPATMISVLNASRRARKIG